MMETLAFDACNDEPRKRTFEISHNDDVTFAHETGSLEPKGSNLDSSSVSPYTHHAMIDEMDPTSSLTEILSREKMTGSSSCRCELRTSCHTKSAKTWPRLALVASIFLLPCRGLQFPSLFDRVGLAARDASSQAKQRALFRFPTTTATTTPSEVVMHAEAVMTEKSAEPSAKVYDNHHHNEEESVLEPQISPDLQFMSDSWWEDLDDVDEAAKFAQDKRNLMVAARRELLLDRTNQRKHTPTTNTKPQQRRQDVSSGARKGSTKSTSSNSQLIFGAIRKAATAAATNTESSSSSKSTLSSKSLKSDNVGESARSNVRPSRSIIESTISDLLDQQLARQGRDLHEETTRDSLRHHGPQRSDGRSMGLFGDGWIKNYENYQHHAHHPMPGTILLPPSTIRHKNNNKGDACCQIVTVRVATPLDDVDIALLRLSVFSDFSPEVRQMFCSRSCESLANRRLRGATCLVATTTTTTAFSAAATTACSLGDDTAATTIRRGLRPETVLGTVECSFHEFLGTTLGRRRPERSILYITEFAVSPTARRQGIGTRLLQAVDELASLRQVESLYLHVDVTNHAALALYNRAGYKRVTSKDVMFDEFTTLLNLHDGATKGRNHFLLCKHLSDNPTWLPPPIVTAESHHSTRTPVFGFEIST